ncbi:MAG: ABC transporter substrate-binding protein [Thermoleophilaceae bacterium]
MGDYEYHLVEEVRNGRMTRRDLVRRATVFGLAAPTIGTLLVACDSGEEPDPSKTPVRPTRGGTGRFGVTDPAADVDPVSAFSTGATMTMQVAGEYLCFPDSEYVLEPRLATSWKADAPDEWTFTIRQGVTWHDGSPMTVDDVVATFDRLTDPEVNSAALSAFRGILSKGNTEKVDAETVKFHLDSGFVDFPYLVSPFNYNAIILPRDYEIGQFTKGRVGTGPYILERYTPKEGARFVKNPNYWAKRLPYMDAVEIRYFDDTPPIVLALQAGEIDVFPLTPFQGSQALFGDSNVTVMESRSSGYHGVHMRTDREPFESKSVRQAVATCLDRPGLVEGLFGGNAEPGNDHAFAPIYPAAEQATKHVAKRSQDHELAKQLLADAGHSGGLDVELSTLQFLALPQYAQLIQQQCESAGINVKLDVQDQAAYYGSGRNQPWLVVPFGIVGWAARGSASQTITPAYICDSVPTPDLSNSGGAWNSAHWCNREFDQLVSQFNRELDEQKRKEIAAEAAKLQNEEVPAIIAFWIKDLRAIRKNVNGLAAGPALHLDVREMFLT